MVYESRRNSEVIPRVMKPPDWYPGGAHQGRTMVRYLRNKILVKEENMETGEDLLNNTKITPQISTNLGDVDREVVGDKLTKEYMSNLWYIKNILRPYENEILLWHHRMNHCNFNTLIRLAKRVIIPKKTSKARNIPPIRPVHLGSTTRGHVLTKAFTRVGQSGIRNLSYNRPGFMT